MTRVIDWCIAAQMKSEPKIPAKPKDLAKRFRELVDLRRQVLEAERAVAPPDEGRGCIKEQLSDR
jgi:ribosomal protein S30